MNLTPNMKTLLAAVLADVRRLEAVPDRPSPGMDREQWYALWRERQEYVQFGVRHDLDRWLGHAPTPSESAVFSRALRNLEALDLVARISRWGGGRTSHVQLTDTGRAAMAALLKDLAPPARTSEMGTTGSRNPRLPNGH